MTVEPKRVSKEIDVEHPQAFPYSDLQAVSTETVQTRVHMQLRQLLMMGRFQPGQALKINDLAKVLGTSTQPVRESIRQLVAERALEALPNRSARVPLLSPERIEDLRRVRLALEGLAAELATERATPQDIDTLRAIAEAGSQADDELLIEASVSRNMEFHFVLYRISGSTVLPPIIDSLWLQIGPGIRRSAEIFDARDGRGTAMHYRIIEGLRAKAAATVREAVEDDINRFFDLLQRTMSTPAAPPPLADASAKTRALPGSARVPSS